MIVKKFGKAKADLESGLWILENKPDKFEMNQRIIESRRDVKIVKGAYLKQASKYIPSTRRPTLRAEYMAERAKLKKELDKLVAQVYVETLDDSQTCPIPLRKVRDTEHNGDWRYCLYQGMIYQFDRPGYTEDEMMEQINASQKTA